MALGELRVITRNSPTTYYTGSNGAEGPEFDLVKGFAEHLGVELKLDTSERFGDLIPTVESGEAHLAAAGLTVTAERAKRVQFGPAYQDVRQLLIYKLGTGRPDNYSDILGKRLEVIAGSSYAESLKDAQQQQPDLVWTENPNSDLAELLTAVSDEKINYTVIDSTLYKVYRNFVPEIRVGFEVKSGDTLAWAFPKRYDNSLVAEATAYIEKIRSTGKFEQIMERYYGHTQRFDYVGTRTFIRDVRRRLPLYRKYFEQAGKESGIDWRLLAAVGYQESHWKPEAVSPTGVRGIMMLTETTAKVMEIEDRTDPYQSIIGGGRYLAKMKARIPDYISDPDRTWIALAAYNVGYGHVSDARQIARKRGENPNLWFDVRSNLKLLTQHSWYSKTRHGYARGWEPIMYVENIRNYYDILVWLTKNEENESRDKQPEIPTIAETMKDMPNFSG